MAKYAHQYILALHQHASHRGIFAMSRRAVAQIARAAAMIL